jgi:DNA-binding NarL/FixJ family response regulator
VVIDGPGDRRQLVAQLVEHEPGVTVAGYADGPVSALEAVGRLGADAAVIEIQLPVSQALDTIGALRTDFPSLAIIVCSFQSDAATKAAAIARGADGYLAKPVSTRELHGIFHSALLARAGREFP